MKAILLFLWMSLCAAVTMAQKSEVLTNKSIVDLTKAGISKKSIISKINSSTCKFSTETQALISLKNSGVDEEVIDAMMAKAENGATAAPATNVKATESAKPDVPAAAGDAQPAQSSPLSPSNVSTTLKKEGSGVYYYQSSDRSIVELDPTVFSQSKNNKWAEAWSYGFAKSKKVMSVSGTNANVQFNTKKPVFYFYFDPENKSLNSQAPTWFASVSSPNEFLIIKFDNVKVKNSRAVTTASGNAYENAAGIDDEFKRAFKFRKLEKGIYEVYFENDLESGEYGFMYAGANATAGGASPKVYDFGVK